MNRDHLRVIFRSVLIVCAALAWWTAFSVGAAEPGGEVDGAHRWAAAAFSPAVAPPQRPEAADADGLSVLHLSHVVLKNRSVWNKPLSLGGKVFEHGLSMDAPASVRVRLARPAVEFTATVGIDQNDDTKTHPDKGSARFHVVVEGKRVFSTPVLRLGDGAKPVRVALGGVKQFVLEVDDGGDGRGWDQCDWADAAVKLDDGSTRRLGDLAESGLPMNRSNVPFSFVYDGRPSDELLPGWKCSETPVQGGEGSQRLVSYQCPKTGLRIECLVTTYPDSPAVDWLCWLVNEGKSETPVIERFLPLDARLLDLVAKQPVTLRWSNGDSCSAESFLPHDDPLAEGQSRSFSANSSDTTCFPFFNVAGPEGGWIVAVGWTGRWRAEFRREAGGRVRVAAGTAASRFRLRPGERVRTPRIVLLRYAGPMIAGHHQFRRMMFRHYVPRIDGKPIQPPVACNNVAWLWLKSKRSGQPLGRLTEASELALIERASKLGCEAYWMDAYWFPQPWWKGNCGNWYPRPDDFPRGLRPLGDAAHRHGMQFILWFAPLHVNPGTVWAKEHPEFVHGGPKGGIYKLCDPQAREFLVGWLSEKSRQWAFDVYREDFGIGVAPEEGPDRLGVAEMKHVDGFYEFWSGLLKRNPRLIIDNCCGGGRRIDLETASRAYTLWRSDFNDVGEGLKDEKHWPRMGRADQVMVGGLSLYFPLHTGPVWDMRPYSFRSAMSSGIVLYTDTESKQFSPEAAGRAIAELKQLRPLWEGDYYPLMPLTASQADWYAYQLDGPDLGEGCAVIFRRPEAAAASCPIELQNIDPDAAYLVSLTGETYDQGPTVKKTGRQLARQTVRIDSRPGSALIRYRKAVRE